MSINRYFIEILLLKFPDPRPAARDEPALLKGRAARRWNRRTVRADVLARGHLRKEFLAGGRINKRRRDGQKGHAKCAHRATLLIFIRLRCMLTAVVCCRVHLHLRAAARFDLRGRRLGGYRREAERTRDRQAKEESQSGSHWEKNTASTVPGQSHIPMSSPPPTASTSHAAT